jgi:hypothetical protein
MANYTPKSGELLYHYCSAQTFMSIIRTRTIRFGDINMMNDSEEFRWGYKVFIRGVNRFLSREKLSEKAPVIPKEFFDAVDEVVSSVQLAAHPFVACFSKEPDSLEQWRAYGDDGRGFAIAFAAEKLERLPVTMFDVLYDQEEQLREMMAWLIVLYDEYQKIESEDSRNEFRLSCADLGMMFTRFKHPTFKAEQEVRCVHALQLIKTERGARKFVDPGGERGGVVFEGQQVGFYVRDGHLTAHVDLPMDVNGTSPIEAVVTGPKNHGGTANLLLYLASEGFEDIRFAHSTIPYR